MDMSVAFNQIVSGIAHAAYDFFFKESKVENKNTLEVTDNLKSQETQPSEVTKNLAKKNINKFV